MGQRQFCILQGDIMSHVDIQRNGNRCYAVKTHFDRFEALQTVTE